MILNNNNAQEKPRFIIEDNIVEEDKSYLKDEENLNKDENIAHSEDYYETPIVNSLLNNVKPFSNRILRLSLGTLKINVPKNNQDPLESDRHGSAIDSSSSSPLRGYQRTNESYSPESPNPRSSVLYGSFSVSQSPERRGTLRHGTARLGFVRATSNISSGSPMKNKTGNPSMHQSSQDVAQRNFSVWDASKGSKVVWTLKKELKTKEDAEYIYHTIKDFPFFSRFVTQNLGEVEEGAILQLCRHMRYETVSAGQYVFKEGDLSNDKLYIILSGKVHIILSNDRNVFYQENLNTEKATEKKFPENFKKKRNLTIFEPKSSLVTNELHKRVSSIEKSYGNSPPLSTDLKKTSTEPFITDIEPENDEALSKPKFPRSKSKRLTAIKPSNIAALSNREFNQGEAFGEKALTSKDSKRSASIFASVDCEFIILMKEDYLSIVGKYNKENRFKLNFLKSNLPYVDQITSTLILEDFLYIFNTKFLKHGNMVVEEGKPGSKIYLLVQGECYIEKKMIQEDSDIAKIIFIARIGAPAIIGEEILYQKRGERKYKYTVKVDSLDSKLYYCQVNALKFRFPRETIQKLQENYNQKERIRDERLNFVQSLENQSLIHKDVREIKSEYKEVMKMAAKGCRSSFFVRPQPSNSTEPIKTKNEKPDGDDDDAEIEKTKYKIDSYSRAYSSIRKRLFPQNQSSLDDYYRSIQYNESSFQKPLNDQILLLGGQTDRPRYETHNSKIDKKLKLNNSGELLEPDQLSSRLLPTPTNNMNDDNDFKAQVESQQRLLSEEKPLKYALKDIIKEEQEKRLAKLGHRRTKSNSEPFDQAKFLILGPKKKITAESLFNKRNYVIRKSYGSENPSGLENQSKIVEKISEKLPVCINHKQTPNLVSIRAIAGLSDSKHILLKKSNEKDLTPHKKKESLIGHIEKNELLNSEDIEKSKYIKRRLLTLASMKENPQLFSKLNYFMSSKNRISTVQESEKNSVKISFGGETKISSISIAPLATLKTEESPVSNTHRHNPLSNTQKVLLFDEIKIPEKNLTNRSTERPSPLVTERVEENKIILSSQNDAQQNSITRRGGKATSVRNLQEKSKQMQALQSIHRIRQNSRKVGSIDEQSNLINKYSKEF